MKNFIILFLDFIIHQKITQIYFYYDDITHGISN